MVIYTGTETKLMQNLGEYRFKRSQTENRVENVMLTNLGIMFLFIFVSSVWNGFKTMELFEKHAYLTDHSDVDATESTLFSIISFYLLFNYAIPLDIAVMLELNAIFYSLYVVWDAKMTYLNEDMGRIEAATMNSLNLMENLGEVDYIMSDKTGTLT